MSPAPSLETPEKGSGSEMPHQTVMILAFVFGFLLYVILAMIFYFYRCRRRARQNRHRHKGSSIWFHNDRMRVSNRPWQQSPTYSSSRPWALPTESDSESSYTNGSESKIHNHKLSEASLSTINPWDSVSQVANPLRVYKFQLKRKPLRTPSDLSALPESQSNKGDGNSRII